MKGDVLSTEVVLLIFFHRRAWPPCLNFNTFALDAMADEKEG